MFNLFKKRIKRIGVVYVGQDFRDWDLMNTKFINCTFYMCKNLEIRGKNIIDCSMVDTDITMRF